LGDELETAFRRSGIIHIVVLSGYNIMIVVTFVLYVLGWFLPVKARLVAGIISIGVFALVVGLGASVVRASIMAGLGLLALVLGRRYAILRALFVAGAGMLVINPFLLVYDVGFQLSFMATLGLILVAPQFETLLARAPTHIGIKDFFIATVATQIAVLPLLLYHIGEFSLVALIVNMLVLPVVPAAMLATFLAGLVALISTGLALPFAYLAYGILTYIIVIATWFAGLPFAALVIPVFPFFLVPVVYGLVGYILYRRNLILPTTSSLMLLITVDTWEIVSETDGTGEVLATTAATQGDSQNKRAQGVHPLDPPFFRR
jgi:competence protein ComEC